MSDLAMSSEPVKPEERKYSKDQETTEADRDTYYRYDLDLIKGMLHNCSTASHNNPYSYVEYTETETIVHRSPTEHLTLAILGDQYGIDLVISVSDPRCEDPFHEMTTIYLSRREVHALRSLLSKL